MPPPLGQPVRGSTAQIEQTFDRPMAWLDSRGARPTFTFLHTFQVHDPYTPPPDSASLFAGDRLAPARDRSEPRVVGLRHESLHRGLPTALIVIRELSAALDAHVRSATRVRRALAEVTGRQGGDDAAPLPLDPDREAKLRARGYIE